MAKMERSYHAGKKYTQSQCVSGPLAELYAGMEPEADNALELLRACHMVLQGQHLLPRLRHLRSSHGIPELALESLNMQI